MVSKELHDLFVSLMGPDAADKVVSMQDTYEERKIAHFAAVDYPLEIDTAYVHDSDQSAPYETAIYDPRYSEDWIVVANAATPEAARQNHDLWVRVMTETPPAAVLDVCHAGCALLRDKTFGTEWREIRRKG